MRSNTQRTKQRRQDAETDKVGEWIMQEACQGQPILCIDTREPEGSGWEPFLTLPVIRKKLDVGDFSLVGCESLISIERKSLSDLISCFCGERDRFTRELQKFQAVPDRWIICEGNYGDLLRGNYRSAMNPKSAWESGIALMTRFHIPLLMAGDIKTAATLAQSLLVRWYREHVSVIETVAKAMKEMTEQSNGCEGNSCSRD